MTRFFCQERSQGHPPPAIFDWVDFFYEKNWLCWDVGPALFSKVTLLSLSEVRTVVVCGSKISQICGPRCCRKAQVLRATKKGCQLFWEKRAPSQLLCPLHCKILATRPVSVLSRWISMELGAIFIMWVGSAAKGFKIRGRRLMS